MPLMGHVASENHPSLPGARADASIPTSYIFFYKILIYTPIVILKKEQLQETKQTKN